MTELVYRAPAGEVAAGPNVAARGEAVEAWLRECAASSVHTAARYRRDIAVFFAWVDQEGLDVATLLPWNIGEYKAWLADGGAGELKASTQAGRLNAVSAFYRYLQQNSRGTPPPNPAEHVKRPKFERRVSTTEGLEPDELAAVRGEARRRGTREYALVQLLVGTGLRISEVVGADAHHLRRAGGEWYLHVRRKGYQDRVPVQVPATAVRALHNYLRGRKGPLFLDNSGKRMSRQVASNRIRYIAVAAGVTGKKISPHSLRHTMATLSLSAGVPIQEVQAQLGHASIETTTRYDRANRRRNNAAVRAMDEIIADDTEDPEV